MFMWEGVFVSVCSCGKVFVSVCSTFVHMHLCVCSCVLAVHYVSVIVFVHLQFVQFMHVHAWGVCVLHTYV